MLFSRTLIGKAASPSTSVAEATRAFTVSVAEFYREAGPFALSKTTYLVGRQDVAEEIVQDVFLKLWQLRLEFPTRRHAYSWVYRACHNAGIDHLRQRRREVPLPEKPIAPAHLKQPDTPGERVANQELLAQFVGKLSEREASIVTYRFIDGMQVKDIASMMDISEKTVQRTLVGIQERYQDWWRASDA